MNMIQMRTAVISLLCESNVPMTTDEVAEALGLAKHQAKSTLMRLTFFGLVRRVGKRPSKKRGMPAILYGLSNSGRRYRGIKQQVIVLTQVNELLTKFGQ